MRLLSLLFIIGSIGLPLSVQGAEPVAPQPTKMSIWHAVALGAIEGFTEYLPVSSTGHLILAQRAMGIGQSETDKQAADAYSISIQAGAILAVLSLYFPYMRRMGAGLLGHNPDGRRLAINLAVAFLPAAVIGLLFHAQIKANLFGLRPIVFAWFVGGVAILAVARWNRGRTTSRATRLLEHMTWRHALLIGLLQCVAMWPGTSRSLVTILGGLIVGLNLQSAVIFSFLLGVLTLSAATLYDTFQHGALMLEVFGWLNICAGFLVATLTAVLSVKWFIAYLNKHGLELFGYYRIGLAVIVSILMLSGWLTDQLH